MSAQVGYKQDMAVLPVEDHVCAVKKEHPCKPTVNQGCEFSKHQQRGGDRSWQ
jgi:hypothetical protein